MSTLLVAAAVIIVDGRVLLTRRLSGRHLASLWEFPGGKVEAGEDPRDALVRELREEIGVEATAGEILETTFHRYPKRDVLLLFYRASLRDPSAEIRHLEVADHAWVLPADLPRYELPPADEPVLARVRAILASGA